VTTVVSSRTMDMVFAHENLNGLREMILSGMVCHPLASTCYSLPTSQIWSL